MMKYIYGFFIGILTLAALIWVIQLGIEGKPIAKIKLSEFSSPNQLSQAVTMRLRQELKDHSIVFLGVDPEEPEHLLVWKEFLKGVQEPGWKFDEVIIDSGLGLKEPLGLNEQVFDIKEMEATLKAHWSSPTFTNKRVALVVPNIYSSQLLKDNPVQRLKLNPNEGRILSISMVPMGKNTNETAINRIPCSAEGADYTGQSPLGCVIRKKAMFWSKPLKDGVRLGILEQYGLHDYILFYRPL